MKISIITVCYNSESTIERTIRSVVNQTYNDFEYIIIDVKSTDNTLNIIMKYQELYPDIISFFSEPDSGIYDAMNKGINKATGDLIGIINSDDYYENNALETVSKYYDCDKKYQIIYGELRIINKDEEELRIEFNNINNISKNTLMHPSTFISKSIYNDICTYRTDYRSASDYAFFIEMSKHKDINFIPVYSILANFTIGGVSETLLGKAETNIIKYENGMIDKRHYHINKIKIYFKKILKI